MTSAEYWAERERQKQERVDEITDEQVEKIRKAIADAIDSLDKEIHRIYMKYAVDNKMDYWDALRYLTDDERVEFQRDLKYYIEKYHDPEYVKKYQKELHSLSVRARVQRIEAFIANIKQHASDLEEMLNRGVREEIESVYTEGYLRTLYDIAGSARPEPKQIIPAFNPKVVREIMETPWSGKNYSKKVWDLSGNFASKLEEVVTQGLIQGKHPDVIAREFRTLGFGKTGKGGTAWRAEALIRTEAANVIEQAQLNCYSELNTERYVFMTAKDFKVCSICAELNGKDFPIEDARAGKNYPPMHPICRCTTRAKTRYDDEDESQYDLPYDEWYEKYVQPELDKMDAEKAKEEMTKQLNSLTDEEKDVVTRWTGALASKINTRINAGASTTMFSNDMTLLDKALSKGVIPRDIKLYRDTDVRFLKGYAGGGVITEEAVKGLIGETITNDIYTSTSFEQLDLAARNTFMTLSVPRGTTNALYIEDLAHPQYKYQKEVLFGRGLRYTIKDAKIENEKVLIEAEVLSDD